MQALDAFVIFGKDLSTMIGKVVIWTFPRSPLTAIKAKAFISPGAGHLSKSSFLS